MLCNVEGIKKANINKYSMLCNVAEMKLRLTYIFY